MRYLFACLLCCLSTLSFADLDSRLEQPWTLLDQFDQPFTFTPQQQVLILASSMDAAKWVEQSLQDKPAGYLEERQVVYLADISRMPKAVARLFAVPAMQDYNFRVMLDREARVSQRYPSPQQGVLWLNFQDGKLQSQQLFQDPESLAQALEQRVAP